MPWQALSKNGSLPRLNDLPGRLCSLERTLADAGS